MSSLHEHMLSLVTTFVVSQKNTRHVLYRAAARFRKPSSAILFIHVLIPNLEILRYWAHYLFYGYHVIPTYFDFALMVFHSWTSHHLVAKGHYAGHKNITQPVFHAQMLLRLAISFCSVFLGNPSLHSATIKINAAASYPRILIWAVKRLNVLPKYKDVYAAAMVIGGLLSMHDSGVLYGPQIFIACWAGLCLLEGWVANESVNAESKALVLGRYSGYGIIKRNVVKILKTVGFVDMDVLRQGQASNMQAKGPRTAGSASRIPVPAQSIRAKLA